MSVQLWLQEISCESCGNVYERWLVKSVDEIAGLVSPTNQLSFMSCFDPPFKEAAAIFYGLRGDPHKLKLRNVEDFAEAFCAVPDLAPDGSVLSLDRFGSCPTCGDFQQQRGVPVVPYQFAYGKVERATYTNWKSLTVEEKTGLLLSRSNELENLRARRKL